MKSCGNNTYCCGTSGDCCSDTINVFALNVAEVVTTISASSAYITNPANSVSASDLTSGNGNHALAIGLGVGIGVGGFLLIALAVLFILKRRVKSKRSPEYEKEEEVSELDASVQGELPDTSDPPPPIKVSHTAPRSGVVHEIADGTTVSSVPPQELEANNIYDWEPRNEPEPRDGGFRPVEHTDHRM